MPTTKDAGEKPAGAGVRTLAESMPKTAAMRAKLQAERHDTIARWADEDPRAMRELLKDERLRALILPLLEEEINARGLRDLIEAPGKIFGPGGLWGGR